MLKRTPTGFGIAVKTRLLELGQTQEWLIAECKARTGMYADSSTAPINNCNFTHKTKQPFSLIYYGRNINQLRQAARWISLAATAETRFVKVCFCKGVCNSH